MRRLILVSMLVLAGCARTAETPTATAPPPQAAVPDRAGLVGMTGQEVANRLGLLPTLQIREGNSFKIQFRTATCVLDAYLYPPARGGEPRVEHIDTRSPSGAEVPEASCVAAFQARRS